MYHTSITFCITRKCFASFCSMEHDRNNERRPLRSRRMMIVSEMFYPEWQQMEKHVRRHVTVFESVSFSMHACTWLAYARRNNDERFSLPFCLQFYHLLSAGKDMRVTADSLARVTTIVRQSFLPFSSISFSQTEVDGKRNETIREMKLINRLTRWNSIFKKVE